MEQLSNVAKIARKNNDLKQAALSPSEEQKKKMANSPLYKTSVDARVNAMLPSSERKGLPEVLGYKPHGYDFGNPDKGALTPNPRDMEGMVPVPKNYTMNLDLVNEAAGLPKSGVGAGDPVSSRTGTVNQGTSMSDSIGGTPSNGMPDIVNQATTYNAPTGEQKSPQSVLEDRVAALKNAIMEKQSMLQAAAQKNSDMNKSDIRGNLGRVYGGSNFDTSEASPIVNESNRLNSELTDINRATQASLSEMDASYLSALQNELSQQRAQESQDRQQAFANLLAASGMTGKLGDLDTLQGRQANLAEDQFGLQQDQFTSDEYQRSFQNYMDMMGFDLNRNNQDFNQDMAMQQFGLDASSTNTANNSTQFNDLLRAAGITGYFQGDKTLDRENSEFSNALNTSALLGYMGDTPTLDALQLAQTQSNNDRNYDLSLKNYDLDQAKYLYPISGSSSSGAKDPANMTPEERINLEKDLLTQKRLLQQAATTLSPVTGKLNYDADVANRAGLGEIEALLATVQGMGGAAPAGEKKKSLLESLTSLITGQ